MAELSNSQIQQLVYTLQSQVAALTTQLSQIQTNINSLTQSVDNLKATMAIPAKSAGNAATGVVSAGTVINKLAQLFQAIVTFGSSVKLSGLTASRPLFTDANNLMTNAGIVPVPNGGTGLATLTIHSVILGEGTGAMGFATPTVSGNVLTDNGTGADPSFQALPAPSLPNVGPGAGTHSPVVSITIDAQGRITAIS